MKILISYWYEINTYHVLPINVKNQLISRLVQHVYKHSNTEVQTTSTPGTGRAQQSQNHISNVYYKVERLKTVKLCDVQSCFGCLFAWPRHVQRAELQTTAQSWQLHTLKLQCTSCCIRCCQPHRLSDNRSLELSFCPFFLSAHTAEVPCRQLQSSIPMGTTGTCAFIHNKNADVQTKYQHPMLICHATPRYRSGDFTWPFRASS